MVRQLLDSHGKKLLRYAAVSCVGVTAGQLLLFFFYEMLGLRAVLANTLAVAIATVPSYLLNRAWVWGKNGNHSFKAEIVPFWGMAFVGLVLSNLLVHLAEQRTSAWWVINGANLVAFGVIWLVKFVVLEKVLFAQKEALGQPATAESLS